MEKPNANTRVSLCELARELGVSPVSVSAALRGKKGVSDELRQRILNHAAQRGYQPNPIASELMALVRDRRAKHNTGQLIAYLNTFSRPESYDENKRFHLFNQGAAARAKEFGYQLEVIRARSPGMTGSRLTQILKARGVRGILVGPTLEFDPALDIDWSAFSAVLVGSQNYEINIPRVRDNQMQITTLALTKLEELGYRRIGVALRSVFEASRGSDYVMGVEKYRRDASDKVRVCEWMYDDWEAEPFINWAHEQRLDAIVSLEEYVWPAVQTLRQRIGREIGFASLSVFAGQPYTGVDQRYEDVGALGMDLLRGLLLSGIRGPSQRRQLLLLDGDWVTGSTASRVMPPSEGT